MLQVKSVVLNPDLSPLLAADLTGIDPTLLIAAEADVLRDDSVMYHSRLRKAGVNTALLMYPHAIHAFFRYAATPFSV